MFFKNDHNERSAAPGARFPRLPLRDIIVFPHMVVPLFVGREKSIGALEEAMARRQGDLPLRAEEAKTNEPTPEDIFAVGTIGTIIQLLRLPDGTVKVLVEGKRARAKRFTETEPTSSPSRSRRSPRRARRRRGRGADAQVHSTFEIYVKLNKRFRPKS